MLENPDAQCHKYTKSISEQAMGNGMIENDMRKKCGYNSKTAIDKPMMRTAMTIMKTSIPLGNR